VRTLNGFFDALRALRDERFEGDSFVYIGAPVPLSDREIGNVAACAQAAGLLSRLCLGYPSRPGSADGPARCAAVEAAGLRVALDNVGGDCTFLDFARHGVCALRFDEALTGAAASDPVAASVLEAMVNLARNLGIATLATGVAPECRDTLVQCGVHYLADAGVPGARGPRSDEPAATSSRSRYQDALYGP
jgi:hypothetical protein